MKRILLVLAVVAMLGLACSGIGRQTTDARCDMAWGTAIGLDLTPPGPWVKMQLILNNKWGPSTVGYYLQQCVKEGWYPAELK